MRGCGFFPPRKHVEKSRVELRILTLKIFFRAGVHPFHHSSCQSHHSYYLKVSKISSIPQTRNSHARPSVRQPLAFSRNSTCPKYPAVRNMPTFPYLRIHFLNTKCAFSKHCSSQKVLRNLAAADELPDKFVFRIRIRSSHSRAQDGLWAAVKIVLNGVSRLRMVRVRSLQSCTGWMKR